MLLPTLFTRGPWRRRYRAGRMAQGESLEVRALPANLWVTNAYLTNGVGDVVETPDEGTYVNIVIEFKTLAMPAGATYVVRRTLDGVNYDVTLNWGEGLDGQGNWVAGWGLGYITAGDHVIRATVDAVGEVSETSENDNSLQLTFSTPDTPDPMFINPLAGVPNRDWEIGNRVDMDPGPGFVDYRGNPNTYNGHDALDINLAAGWEQQDSGHFVLASAGGTVTVAVDGNGDRSGDPNSNDAGPSNRIVIDHGGGWFTSYDHLRKNSVRVSRGDIVTTGQLIGRVGSSGNSSGPHLHWAVYHNGAVVETYQRPTELLADPLPYEQEAPGIMDLYTTLSGVTLIGRSEQEVFLPSETPAIWMATQGILVGVRHDIVWYKPNGSEFHRITRTEGSPPILVQIIFLSGELGVWRVTTEIDGVKQAETRFLRSAELQPEVKVTHLATNFTEVSDGTAAPVQFDPVAPTRPGSTRTFSVRNVGNSTLVTGGLTIPNGFTLVEGLSASIESGKADTFTVQLDTSVAGLKSGTVSFTTNDADESIFTFPVRGLVTDLSLTLSEVAFAENAGPAALTGTVTRPEFDLSEPMTVYLSSSDPSEAKVPLRVTIPKNVSSIIFPIDAVDDAILDGNKPVRITSSLIGNVSTTAELTVNDYESLQITFNPGSIAETDGANAATATVTRSNAGNLQKPLIAGIWNNDPSELSVPASVTIPAGETSVTFSVTAVDDAIADGTQSVLLSISAPGFASGSGTVTVLDNESATLSLSIASPLMSENGGSRTATVSRNTATNGAMTVQLTSSDTTETSVPGTVIIPIGASSVSFLVTAVDDMMADGPQIVSISAAAPGLTSGAASLSVIDDEVMAITSPGTLTTFQKPTITWTAVSGAVSYDIWIRNQSTNVSPFLQATVTGTSFVPGSDLGIGKFNLWIRSTNALGAKSAWTPPYNFQIQSQVVLTAMDRFQNTSRPVIRWGSLPGAVRYDIWIDNRTTGETQYIRNQNVTATAWSSLVDMPIALYRAWVRGIDAGGIPGQWSSAAEFFVVPAPAALAPLSSTFSRRPTFSWNTVAGAETYEVTIRNRNTGADVYQQKRIPSASWTPPVNLPDGPYRWWVMGVSSNNVRGLWTSPVDFWVGGRPEVIGPVGISNSARPLFQWKAVAGSIRYELFVTHLGVQGGIINQTQLTNTEYIPAKLLTSGSFRFWVRAISSAGEISPWSLQADFSVAANAVDTDSSLQDISTACPSLTVTSLETLVPAFSLVEEYFSAWTRRNENVRTPVINADLGESDSGNRTWQKSRTAITNDSAQFCGAMTIEDCGLMMNGAAIDSVMLQFLAEGA